MAIEIEVLRTKVEALRAGIEKQFAPVRNKVSLVPPFLKEQTAIFTSSKQEADKESEEITDPFKTLEGLKTKAGIMLEMIDRNEVEQLPIRTVGWIIRRIWFANLVKDGGIEGLGHLRNAIAQTETEEPKRLVFTPAHCSDADHPVALHEMKQGSRGLGIQEEIVWMGGVNMKRRPAIGRFMRGGHVIYNVTPRDADHLQTLIDRKEEYRFNEEQIQELESIRVTFNKMREAAKQRVLETCEKEKKPLVFYPEGGRSYDGMLKKSPGELVWFFPRHRDKSVLVVPYRVYGAVEINPPGSSPRVLKGRWELIAFWRRQRISMTVGQPYSSQEIWDIHKIRSAEVGKDADGKKIKVNPMDWVMANIANLDPDFVTLEDQSYYGGLLDRFAQGRRRFRLPEEITA